MERTFIALVLTFLLAGGNCLAAETGTLDPYNGKPCYKCHRSKVNAAKMHPALADNQCEPCHSTTGGDHKKILGLYLPKDKSATLCWQCHESVASQKSVHPIISAEGCLPCHNPHNSPLDHLLRAEPPQLCFRCHDRSLVDEKETTKATEFRDGVQSLHNLHAGQSGIPCLTCHDMHASSQEHLIRPKSTNGKEAVTITYTPTDKGGSCAPSCHDSLTYTRK